MGDFTKDEFEEKVVRITSENKEYLIEKHYSFGKLLELNEKIDIYNNIDYKRLLSEFLKVKSKKTLSSEEVYLLDDVLKKFIRLNLEESPKIRKVYEKINSENIFEKYLKSIVSVESQTDIEWKDLYIKLSKRFLDINKFSKITNDIQSNLSKLASVGISISAENKKILNFTKQLGVSLFKFVAADILSKDVREKVEKNYSKWGEFGWSLPPDAPISLFLRPPKTKREANSIIYQYIRESESIFTECRKRVDKNIIDEAQYNFVNKKYRSCALLLLSEIDGMLIKCQEKNNKKVGKKAVAEFKKKILSNQALELSLRSVNVISNLNVVFESAENFKRKPSSLKRNYIMHGMYANKVIKQDCIKLLLIIYNLNFILDANRN
jgi:hypothetical protein